MMCTYLNGRLIAFTGEIPPELSISTPQLRQGTQKLFRHRTPRELNKHLDAQLPSFCSCFEPIRQTDAQEEERSRRNWTFRTCDRKPRYISHDSHGFHGRKPRYKEHAAH